jgi:hypothetical protein
MKIFVKNCENCGKTFVGRSDNKKYCSRYCKVDGMRTKREKEEVPCWRCKRSILECSWMRNLQPVEGWDAEPVVVVDKEGDIRTYKIKSCPKFC